MKGGASDMNVLYKKAIQISLNIILSLVQIKEQVNKSL